MLRIIHFLVFGYPKQSKCDGANHTWSKWKPGMFFTLFYQQRKCHNCGIVEKREV